MKIKSKLTRNQKKHFTVDSNCINKPVVTVDGVEYRKVTATVRFDDECGNGHNLFSITGNAWEVGSRRHDPDTCGCIHDIIKVAFPELAPFIKWHLSSSDGPMHYIANTLYHARTCTHEGKKPGDPVKFERYLRFENIPFTFSEQISGFWKWLDKQHSSFSDIEVVTVEKRKDNHIYAPNYTLTGFIGEKLPDSEDWYNCPFSNVKQANEFLQALKTHKYSFIEVPVKWAESIEPNVDAARNSAVWPESTLEQLQNRELLESRLPELISGLKDAVESLGMEF